MKKNRFAALIAAVVATAWLAGPAAATGHQQTVTFDPTPGQPNSGDECPIKIHAPADTAQSRADVAAVKAALENALMKSDDMRTKVGDACGKHGNMLMINVVRDSKGVFIGETDQKGNISVDPGDIDAATGQMEGDAADKDKVAANLLAELLAHEIDHNRHSATDDHNDPAKDGGTTGKPVDDENAVLMDLGAGVMRNNYVYRDKKDGNLYVDWTVGTKKVRLKVSKLTGERSGAGKFGAADEHVVPPAGTQNIPAGPCNLVNPPCYPPVGQTNFDFDLDGVPDQPILQLSTDNCPFNLANPQQADTDHDDRGQGCDLDDDADGAPSAAETGMGSSDMSGPAMPEHWAINATCIDGLDNDLDGLIDADDESCLARLPAFDLLPGPVAAGASFPVDRRRDLGGVPEQVDTLDSFFDITYDIDFDAIPDQRILVQGPTVVQRKPPLLVPMEPVYIETEMVAMDLRSAGPINVTVNFRLPSLGRAQDANPTAPGDFPAESFFDVFVEIELPSLPTLHNQQPLRLEAEVHEWAPHGEVYRMPQGHPPVVLFTPGGAPAGQVLDWTFGAYGQGDCNSDRKRDAGDLSAAVNEIFDGDGDLQPFVTQGGPAGFHGRPIGCDANGDSRVDAGDVGCTVLLIFGGAGACE